MSTYVCILMVESALNKYIQTVYSITYDYICTKLPRGLRMQLKNVNIFKEIINAFLRHSAELLIKRIKNELIWKISRNPLPNLLLANSCQK